MAKQALVSVKVIHPDGTSEIQQRDINAARRHLYKECLLPRDARQRKAIYDYANIINTGREVFEPR